MVNNRGIISTLTKVRTDETSKRSYHPVDKETRRLAHSTTSKQVNDFAPELPPRCASISHSLSHPDKYTQLPS